ERIIDELYKNIKGIRYNFNDIPADIFGRIYEQYLSAIQQESALVKSKRKSQGIFYTPRFVVDYITKNTVGYKLTQSASELRELKVLDPACGSGSFLISTFLILDDYLRQLQNRSNKNINEQKAPLSNYIRRLPILKNNIFGVDLDEKAVEIAQLNLMLKVLEGENLLPDLEENIKQGNSLIFGTAKELKKFYGDRYKDKSPFIWQEKFKEVFNRKNPGFDIIIGNPPWGANIDEDIEYLEKYYPDSTKQYKDIYKVFIDKSLQLLRNGGLLGFIVPNTFLFQPRYKDIRQLLLKFKLLKIVNLGERIFEGVEAPCCIFIVQKASLANNIIEVLDLSQYKTNDIKEKLLKNLNYVKIKQDDYLNTPDNIFSALIKKKKEDELPLDEIMDCRDAGIKYQRINVGLQRKGDNDLYDRLFYTGKIKNVNDKQYIIGKDVNRYKLEPQEQRYLRHNFKNLLQQNEIVYFNEKYLNHKEKVVWRQTSDILRATIINKIWFANTLQVAILKNEWKNKIDIYYLLALLNSKYLNYLYIQNVRETGRVFPQVKLGKVKILPIKLASKSQQKVLSDLAKRMLELDKQLLGIQNDDIQHPEEEREINNQLNKTDSEIDQKVYGLYGLTDKEIEIVENSYNK
ncbi:N-6 DNA methylase, partial [Patescibacteria group bacterium]|nr:N-6 DNA methylase [Patescibacteria group bacterium]